MTDRKKKNLLLALALGVGVIALYVSGLRFVIN